jgi:hypothetical protein
MSSSMQTFKSAKPAAIALVVGLIAGPLISNYVGWQVTSHAAQAQVQAGIVEQQALFCEARARADVTTPQSLSYTARYDLAKKWATMPGATEAQSGVVSACGGKLAAQLVARSVQLASVPAERAAPSTAETRSLADLPVEDRERRLLLLLLVHSSGSLGHYGALGR